MNEQEYITAINWPAARQLAITIILIAIVGVVVYWGLGKAADKIGRWMR